MIAAFDLIAAAAVCAIAYILYKRFVAPGPGKDKMTEIAYEQGFSDAVKYFGLKKLYKDDPELKQRMNEVFSEAGAQHKLSKAIEGNDRGKERPDRRLG